MSPSTSMVNSSVPIPTIHLFPKIDRLLIKLLKSLTPDEWQMRTIANFWTVKDIASHLLDGNLRTLSFSRDGYFGERPPAINSYSDLVNYLNVLNADWTKATRRLSPAVLIELLQLTGKQFCRHLNTLNPFDQAVFSVAWAGEDESANWFHIAREYTEKWIHQQQIWDAVHKPGLMTRELFYPLIDVLVYGLPHTYRNVEAEEGTVIQLTVATVIGGDWYLVRTAGKWRLTKSQTDNIAAQVIIEPDTAWKLFSKGMTPERALEIVILKGDEKLGEAALQMVSVMA